MRRLFAALLFLFVVSLSTSTAQDKSVALTQAKTKFEQDIAKAEEALLASMEKTQTKAQAANNKQLVEKLTYERDLFMKYRLVPTAVPTATYLKQRMQAAAALESVYNPEIKKLRAKRDSGAEELEITLHDLLKASRGYGQAFPDLETRPMFVIENKGNGLVIETENKDGSGKLVLGPKVGKKKKDQCWYIDREEAQYIIRNAASGRAFHVPHASQEPGMIFVADASVDRTKEPHPGCILRLTEIRRELTISHAKNELVMTVTETKMKGVTSTQLTQEKKLSPPGSTQLWIVSEAK